MGRLTLFQTNPGFLRVCSTSLLKTQWEKEKLLVTSNFSFSHSVFYPFRELSAIFIKFEIVVCKLFQFRRVKNLLFGKGLRYECVHFLPITIVDSLIYDHYQKASKFIYAEKSLKVYFLVLSSAQNNTILDWSKLKAIANDKINEVEKLKVALGCVENIVWKRENSASQHFLFFPQCFQKASLSVSLRVGIVW